MPADSAAPESASPDLVDSEHPSEATISADEMSAIMGKLNIEPKLQEGLVKEPEATAEVEPEPEVAPPESELEPEKEPEPEQEEGEPDDEDEDKIPSSIEKVHRRNQKLRKRAQRAEDKIEELEAKYNAAIATPPIVVQPTEDNPLAHVTTLEQLEAERQEYKLLRERAEEYPEGWIANEGKENEVVVGPKEARKWWRISNDVLNTLAPSKEKELKEVRPNSEASARKIMPSLYDRTSPDYLAAHSFWKNIPAFASHPLRDEITAVLLKGYKQLQLEAQAAKSQDNVPDKILNAKAERAKTPLQKQTPPGRPAAAAAPDGGADVRKALDQLNKSGGDRNSVAAALKAYDKAYGSNGKNGRDPVPA